MEASVISETVEGIGSGGGDGGGEGRESGVRLCHCPLRRLAFNDPYSEGDPSQMSREVAGSVKALTVGSLSSQAG